MKTCNSNSRFCGRNPAVWLLWLFSETSSAVLSLGLELLVLRAVQIIEPMDEILRCDHSKETSSTVVLTFESVDETLWCDHSNETSSTVLSHSTTCFARSFNFWVGSQWTTETIQTKPLICFAYACQAVFEFISLVSQQNNNVTQTSSSCCSSRFTVSWEVVNLTVLSCKDDLSDETCFSKLAMSS